MTTHYPPSPYAPQENSLPDRVCQFFKRVPDEELSTCDIAAKFNARYQSIQTKLLRAVQSGLLKKEGPIYRAGENIREL